MEDEICNAGTGGGGGGVFLPNVSDTVCSAVVWLTQCAARSLIKGRASHWQRCMWLLFQVVTAMAAMAALARGGGHGEKEILVQGRSFQTLVDMVLLGSRRYSCPDLLSVLSSCGAVGCDDDHLIDKARTAMRNRASSPDLLPLRGYRVKHQCRSFIGQSC